MAKVKNLTPEFPLTTYEEETLIEIPSTFSDFVGEQSINTPTVVRQNHIESSDFVTGVSGWRLDSEGNLEANDGTFRGDIEANSINIPDSTDPLFSVDSAGNVTAIGMTSLNMKVYTCFETAGRFIESTSGSGSATFGNQGVTIAPGTTATSHDRLLWWITGSVFNNNPTFTCSLLCLGGFEVGDGVGFVGLGNPTISGSGFTETGVNYCGFEFKKTTGVTTIIAVQCDGGGTVTFSGTLRTLTDGDYIELFIKKNGTTSIDYYTRLNGGALSAKTTLSATLPSGGETHIQFSSSNKGTTDNFQIQLQTAAYEH